LELNHRTLILLALVGILGFVAPGRAEDATRALDWPALEREAVELLSAYLAIDTVNPPGNEIRGVEFFRKIFAAENIPVQVFESAPGRGNIVARLRGNGTKPAVVLMHHIDVVPADARHWKLDPLGGEVKDGYIWGRGALDTKGLGITHAITLLALARQGAQLAGDVVFLATADEEAGGMMGAGFLVEKHIDLFKDVGVVLNEGGIIAASGGKALFYGVEATQKVPLWLRLKSVGIPGHGSMPRHDSAANKLIRALGRINSWETPIRVVPQVQEFYAAIAHLAGDSLRDKYSDLRTALLDPTFATEFTAEIRDNAMVRNTISLTALSGSNKTNVISPEATAELDIRLLPDQDPGKFIEELKGIIGEPSIEIETLLSFQPSTSPKDHELFSVLRELAAKHDPGAVVTPQVSAGFTDCHYFREHEIPCYGFWPFRLAMDDIAGAHGNDERLSVANMTWGSRLTYELVSRLAGARIDDR
jgi:acetylornithine deacetylase/succinyl-diaminopimelate desuccinylase-like protein